MFIKITDLDYVAAVSLTEWSAENGYGSECSEIMELPKTMTHDEYIKVMDWWYDECMHYEYEEYDECEVLANGKEHKKHDGVDEYELKYDELPIHKMKDGRVATFGMWITDKDFTEGIYQISQINHNMVYMNEVIFGDDDSWSLDPGERGLTKGEMKHMVYGA